MPVVKLSNYSCKNTNGLVFENTSKDWGFTKPSFSNVAAYADLDNDGDLDVIINNINDDAFVYENTLNDSKNKINVHGLAVSFIGNEKNINGIGSIIHVYYEGKQEYYEHYLTRGYLSTDDSRHILVWVMQQK